MESPQVEVWSFFEDEVYEEEGQEDEENNVEHPSSIEIGHTPCIMRILKTLSVKVVQVVHLGYDRNHYGLENPSYKCRYSQENKDVLKPCGISKPLPGGLKAVFYTHATSIVEKTKLTYYPTHIHTQRQGGCMDKKVIKTKNAPEAIGPYSQAIQAGEFIFCSGQIPINPKTGDHIKGSPSEQARQVLQNITGILEETGCTLEDVVKVTVYLTSMDFFKEVNETYKEFFKINPPARVAVAVSALPLGFNVEMDAIAKTR